MENCSTTMEEFERYKDLPTWAVPESSCGIYRYPISLQDKDAIAAGPSLVTHIPPALLRRVGPFLTYTSPESHFGPFLHSIDFLIPDGTDVLAGADGVIVDVVEDNTEYGNDPSYADKLNYVTIRHEIDDRVEYSQYCHLATGSVSDLGLKKWSVVRAGQPIAKVGKTGWTGEDHLHFIVFRDDQACKDHPFSFRSLEVRFFEEPLIHKY